jgi:hypothetical protein
VCDSENKHDHALPFKLIFADKKANSSGLQLADLVARPIGLQVIRPEQENKAFNILEKKFYSKNGREGAGTDYEGYGLKRFPRAIKAKGPGDLTRAITPTGHSQSTC